MPESADGESLTKNIAPSVWIENLALAIVSNLRNVKPLSEKDASLPNALTLNPTSPRAMKRLAIHLRVLDIMHENLRASTLSTKRDVFYHDVPLFVRQLTADSAIDDLAAAYGSERESLGVTASPRAVLVGAKLSLVTNLGNTISFDATNEVSFVPLSHNVTKVGLMHDTCTIVIIEKEATFSCLFRHICGLKELKTRLLLVTSKGYPDQNVRRFLRIMRESNPSLRFIALVDCDLHGLRILDTYLRDSAPDIEYAGLKPSQASGFLTSPGATQKLTESDVNGIQKLLRSPLPSELSRSLQQMLHMRIKCELQSLENDQCGDGHALYSLVLNHIEHKN